MKRVILAAAVVFAFGAQANLLNEVCEADSETAAVTEAEYQANPTAYADNFCVLAKYDPQKAFAQLNKAVIANRTRGNAHRFYFKAKEHWVDGGDDGQYIQLLTPEQYQSGWRISQPELSDLNSLDDLCEHPIFHAVYVAPDDFATGPHMGKNQGFAAFVCYDQNSRRDIRVWRSDCASPRHRDDDPCDGTLHEYRFHFFLAPLRPVRTWVAYHYRHEYAPAPDGYWISADHRGSHNQLDSTPIGMKKTVEATVACLLGDTLKRERLFDMWWNVGSRSTEEELCPRPVER